MCGAVFLSGDSLRRVEVPSPKIVINLSRTYEKLHSKKEPYQLFVHETIRYTITSIRLLTRIWFCRQLYWTNLIHDCWSTDSYYNKLHYIMSEACQYIHNLHMSLNNILHFKKFCNKFRYNFVKTFIFLFCIFSSDTLPELMFVCHVRFRA